MRWLTDFLEREHAWLLDAEARGLPESTLQPLRLQLERLEAAQQLAAAEEVDVQEAADISGLHPETVRRKVRAGKFGPRVGRGRITLTRNEVAELGTKRRKSGPAQTSLVDHFTRAGR